MNYNVLQTSLYHVNFQEDKVEFDKIEKIKAEEYISSIIDKSIGNENVRYFKVKRESTETIGLINIFIKNLYESINSDAAATSENGSKCEISSISNLIAIRLMEAEKKAQAKILKMKINIKKGSLIQSVIIEDGKLSYILEKLSI